MDQSLDFHVTGRRLFEICCCAVFNHYRVKIGGTPIHYHDTEATYALSVSGKKLSKAKLVEFRAFLEGVAACYRAF